VARAVSDGRLSETPALCGDHGESCGARGLGRANVGPRPLGEEGKGPLRLARQASASLRVVSCLRFLTGRRSLARRRCSCNAGSQHAGVQSAANLSILGAQCRSTVCTTRPATTSASSSTLRRNLEPGDVVVLADGREAVVTTRVEAEPGWGQLVAMLEVAIAPSRREAEDALP
jgi:hypothetical protein